MAENQNIEYEKLVQDIYQTLHTSEFNTIKVEHNKRVVGKSGCHHQVDVYWEFEMVGETHCVAIECKNYSSEVEIGRIRDFFGVIYDIGNVKGILVTKVGYQSGAKRFADYYGISLKEIRLPTEKDWEGRVKIIKINLSAFIADIKKRELVYDYEWLLKNKNFTEEEVNSITIYGCSNEILIYNSSSKIITDFHQMQSDLPYEFKEAKALEHNYDFADGFINIRNLGKIKINSVKFTYDVVSVTEQLVSDGEAIAKAILKDVKSGDIKFFDKRGNVK